MQLARLTRGGAFCGTGGWLAHRLILRANLRGAAAGRVRRRRRPTDGRSRAARPRSVCVRARAKHAAPARAASGAAARCAVAGETMRGGLTPCGGRLPLAAPHGRDVLTQPPSPDADLPHCDGRYASRAWLQAQDAADLLYMV
eukprot:3761973-Prymnesium_polylepis.1